MQGATNLRFIVLALSLVFGCSEPTLTSHCVNDHDCNEGRVCTLGQCSLQKPDFFGLPAVTDSVASVCATWAHAQCEKEEGCTADAWFRSAYRDREDCARLNEYNCRQQLSEPSFLQSARTRAQCAAELEEQTCDDWLYEIPNACFPSSGSLPDYSACHSDEECVLYSICSKSDKEYCGRCEPLMIIDDGQSCPQSKHTSCELESECFRGSCVERTPEGRPCGTDLPHCEYGTVCMGGSCIIGVGYPGYSCADSESCNARLGQCSSSGGVCVSLQPALAGSPCGKDSHGLQPQCVDGSSCSGTESAVCELRLPIGSDCDPSGTQICAAPSYCVDRKCRLMKPSDCR
jgi:hypothetical protein